jgi:hypothetical protein
MRLINWELPLILCFRLGPVLRAVIAFVIASFRSRTALQFEILALRHQVGVLQRSMKRPKLTPADRVLWAWLCCIWKGWQSGAFIMKAATVVGWHRKGFGLFWSWKILRGKLGRPAVPTEVRELIRIVPTKNSVCPYKYSAARRIKDLAGVLVTLLLALSNGLGMRFGFSDITRS